MKVEEKDIWMDDSLNNSLWAMGKYKIPSKIRVKAVKFDDGVVETYVPELEFKKSRRELLKEEKAKKEPILKREEVEPEEGEAAGAEDYDITPTADGEVKIKKKKAPKEKKEKKPSKEKEKLKKEKPKKEKGEKPKKAKKKSETKKVKNKDTKPKKKPSNQKTSKKKSINKKK